MQLTTTGSCFDPRVEEFVLAAVLTLTVPVRGGKNSILKSFAFTTISS